MFGRFVSRVSRRSFLTKSAVAAVAVGVLGAAPRLVASIYQSSASESNELLNDVDSAPSDPMVAYVRDAAEGEVVFMVGTEEVVRNDPVLVSRLLAAMRSA